MPRQLLGSTRALEVGCRCFVQQPTCCPGVGLGLVVVCACEVLAECMIKSVSHERESFCEGEVFDVSAMCVVKYVCATLQALESRRPRSPLGSTGSDEDVGPRVSARSASHIHDLGIESDVGHTASSGLLRKKLYDQNLSDWSARYRKNKQGLDNLIKDCDALRADVAKHQGICSAQLKCDLSC